MTATLQELNESPLAHTLQDALGSLLNPISSETPTGPSLRFDPLYARIRAARHVGNEALPQGIWQRDPPQADWAVVDQLATDALETRSKDLQLAIWRTEALVHLHGLPGLAGGCQLILGLHCRFASSMHPAPQNSVSELPLNADDPGIEGRLNLLQWINDKLSVQLKLLPITAPDELTGVPSFTLSDMESARLQNQHQGGSKPRESLQELFEQSLALTPSSWFSERWSELQHTTQMVFLLDDVLDTVYGQANGGLLKVKKVLEEMHTMALPALTESDRMPFPVVATAEPPATTAEIIAIPPAGSALGSPEPDTLLPAVSEPFQIRSRAEAYRRLADISEFLTCLEPHSPVPYLCNARSRGEACRWRSCCLSCCPIRLLCVMLATCSVWKACSPRFPAKQD